MVTAIVLFSVNLIKMGECNRLFVHNIILSSKCLPDKVEQNDVPRTQIEQNLMKLIYFIMDPKFLPAMMVTTIFENMSS